MEKINPASTKPTGTAPGGRAIRIPLTPALSRALTARLLANRRRSGRDSFVTGADPPVGPYPMAPGGSQDDLAGLDGAIAQSQERLRLFDERISAAQGRVDTLDKEIVKVEARIEAGEHKVAAISKRMQDINTELTEINKRDQVLAAEEERLLALAPGAEPKAHLATIKAERAQIAERRVSLLGQLRQTAAAGMVWLMGAVEALWGVLRPLGDWLARKVPPLGAFFARVGRGWSWVKDRLGHAAPGPERSGAPGATSLESVRDERRGLGQRREERRAELAELEGQKQTVQAELQNDRAEKGKYEAERTKLLDQIQRDRAYREAEEQRYWELYDQRQREYKRYLEQYDARKRDEARHAEQYGAKKREEERLYGVRLEKLRQLEEATDAPHAPAPPPRHEVKAREKIDATVRQEVAPRAEKQAQDAHALAIDRVVTPVQPAAASLQQVDNSTIDRRRDERARERRYLRDLTGI